MLHLRQLPDFDGHLRASKAELLLQYLTVPYLRIPLLLDFFDADSLYALQVRSPPELPRSPMISHDLSDLRCRLPLRAPGAIG